MPHDPHLADRMRAALKGRAGITEKKMVGGYCWMLRGNMLCGVDVGRFMFRIGKALEADALARRGASPMDITGRPMRGFVWVRAENADGKALQAWIGLASQYVAALPATSAAWKAFAAGSAQMPSQLVRNRALKSTHFEAIHQISAHDAVMQVLDPHENKGRA